MPSQNPAYYLTRQGTPYFDILLPANPAAALEFAAEELRRTLYSMTGNSARLRHAPSRGGATIVLNDWQAAGGDGIDVEALKLGWEGYHLETRQGRLHILGNGPRGVLYGVYALLDSLGCRWFTPEISRIPRRPSLRLPELKISAAPAFESRDTFNRECRDALWWVRSRMNGWYTPVPEYMGGHIDYCGFVHTFYDLLPPGQYFDAHPEYYSLVGGQRRGDQAQLCLSNPEVLRLVTRAVLERMRSHPQATIFSVSQNDCQGYCECPECAAIANEEGAQSGPLLRFVNAVAEAAGREFPDKLIDTLAYQYSLEAPRRVRPHPNVRVRLCSITCCQAHEYGTCDHPESQRFLAALDGWRRVTDQLYIWHYATNFTHYPLPMPDLDELHDNIALYQRYGVHGVFIQGMGEPGGGAELMALRGYLVSRLLWNPQQPAWPIVDEFLPAYFGAAAGGVRRYLELFHSRLGQDHSFHVSLYDLPTNPLYDDDLRRPADEALAEAERLVRGEQRQRVRRLRAGLDYVRLFRAAGAFKRQGDTYRGQAGRADAAEFAGLARLWRQAGLQRIREAEPLETSLQRLGGRLQAHKVEWLVEGDQRIAVVPGLGGRLLEWWAGGRQWLAAAEADSTWSTHPFSGGMSEFAGLGMYERRGGYEAYRAEWQGSELVLSADLEAGLHLVKRLRLEDCWLHIDSRLENRASEPVKCSWGAAWSLALDEGAVFKAPEGGVELAVARLVGVVTLSGAQIPAGKWQVEAQAVSLRYEMMPVPLNRMALAADGGGLKIELQILPAELGPGEGLAVRQTIKIETKLLKEA